MSFDLDTESMESTRPLVTFVLLSYNQEAFIAQALAGAFAQTYSPLQIILSDDCSSDSTFDIMKEAARQYSGPHQIILNRNECNLGIGGHINKVVDLAEGEWIVGAAADDISLPERTSEIVAAASKSGGKARSIWSRARHMGPDGELLELFEHSNDEPYSTKEMINNKRVVMGCSHAWHKDVFKVFGPLYHKVMFEDNAISFRSYLLGEIIYIDKTLVFYRQHASNATNYSQKIDQSILIRKMTTRRQYAIVGVYQRLLDVITYKESPSVGTKDLRVVNRLLLRQLLIQILKMNIASTMPSADRLVNWARKTLKTFKK